MIQYIQNVPGITIKPDAVKMKNQGITGETGSGKFGCRPDKLKYPPPQVVNKRFNRPDW
jgi:hypothetical protein